MKAIPIPNLALKLAPNDNFSTEELVGILWTEFKLFLSNWKRFDCYFSLLYVSMYEWKHESMKANLSQKAMKLAPNDN